MDFELFNRAMTLGYDEGGAARVAESVVNYGQYGDLCPKHPGMVMLWDGPILTCEACIVVAKSDEEGYYPGKWEAMQAERAVEYVAIMERQITEAFAAGECACDLITELGGQHLPEGGRACRACGSIFTASGTEASAAVYAESEAITARKLATPSGMDVLADLLSLDGGKTPAKVVRVKAPKVAHMMVEATGKSRCGRTVAANGTGEPCKACAKVKAEAPVEVIPVTVSLVADIRPAAIRTKAAESAEMFEVSPGVDGKRLHNPHSRFTITRYEDMITCCHKAYLGEHMHMSAQPTVILAAHYGPQARPVIHTVTVGDVINVDGRAWVITNDLWATDPILLPADGPGRGARVTFTDSDGSEVTATVLCAEPTDPGLARVVRDVPLAFSTGIEVRAFGELTRVKHAEAHAMIVHRQSKQQYRRGDVVTFSINKTRKLWQEKPFACRDDRSGCAHEDNRCHGVTVVTTEILIDVIDWADGAREIKGDLGGRREVICGRLD